MKVLCLDKDGYAAVQLLKMAHLQNASISGCLGYAKISLTIRAFSSTPVKR